jgi:hypothetical protein
MRIRLKQSIIGYSHSGDNSPRVHATEDEVLQVIFRNPTHFICDSLQYPNQPIIVFNSQCDIIDKTVEASIEDPYAEEKYYHVYEDKSNLIPDDSFYTAFEFDDPQ